VLYTDCNAILMAVFTSLWVRVTTFICKQGKKRQREVKDLPRSHSRKQQSWNLKWKPVRLPGPHPFLCGGLHSSVFCWLLCLDDKILKVKAFL
jgi:hypothetical protein